MKTILLLRHAKSAWSDASLSDHDRPLSRRGERAAKALADHLADQSPRPDLILCSTATRARQTLAPLVALWSPAPPISLEKALYLAPENVLMARLRQLPDDVGAVMLIGHNDGIWQLGEALAGTGKATTLAALREKFPTGALATLRVPVEHWSDLAAGTAELSGFVRPRDLMGA